MSTHKHNMLLLYHYFSGGKPLQMNLEPRVKGSAPFSIIIQHLRLGNDIGHSKKKANVICRCLTGFKLRPMVLYDSLMCYKLIYHSNLHTLATRALVRVGLAHNQCSSSYQRCWMQMRSVNVCNVFTWLCAWWHCHVETRKSVPQLDPHNFLNIM